MSKTIVPYGSWSSPISAELTGKCKDYSSLQFDQNARNSGQILYWSTVIAEEEGRSVVFSLELDGRNFRSPISWTPTAFSARTRVHEYGGGEFFVHSDVVYFSNMCDQQLYKQTSPGDYPQQLTKTANHFFADGCYSTATDVIFIVCEDHSNPGPSNQALTTLTLIDPHTGDETVLVKGSDFYSSPRLSSDGQKLAWVEWDFPNMPWDNTRLVVGNFDPASKTVVRNVVIAEGTDSHPDSLMHPSWTADGALLYMSDRTGFWNLWLSEGNHSPVNLINVEKDLAHPPWEFNTRTYSYVAQTDELAVALPKEGFILLRNVKQAQRAEKSYVKTQPDVTHHHLVLLADDHRIFSVGSSYRRFPAILCTDSNQNTVVVVDGEIIPPGLDPTYLSHPVPIPFLTDGVWAHCHYYPPTNPLFAAPSDELPPLLVYAHGGPTSNWLMQLDLRVQFWTSRGFAYLAVDYRGSTGYGRAYRDALKGQWGEMDVSDCCAAVQHVVREGRVDGNRLCIDGASAGGLTTLNALTFRDIFQVGTSWYGVSDMEGLVRETHKFESRYLDGLVGPYPDSAYLYHARSCCHHLDRMSRPILFLHGTEDVIVRPNQAQKAHEALRAKGVPCALVLYDKEGHGFRAQSTISHALEAEYYFYCMVLGMEPKGVNNKIHIDNLSP